MFIFICLRGYIESQEMEIAHLLVHFFQIPAAARTKPPALSCQWQENQELEPSPAAYWDVSAGSWIRKGGRGTWTSTTVWCEGPQVWLTAMPQYQSWTIKTLNTQTSLSFNSIPMNFPNCVPFLPHQAHTWEYTHAHMYNFWLAVRYRARTGLEKGTPGKVPGQPGWLEPGPPI